MDVNEADAMQWFRDWVLHLFIQLINFSLFRMASKNGHPHSSYNLAIGYLNGIETDIQGVSVKVTFSPSMSQGLNLIKYW